MHGIGQISAAVNSSAAIGSQVIGMVESLSDVGQAGQIMDIVAPMAMPESGDPDLWEAALTLGNYYNEHELKSSDRQVLVDAITVIREHQGELARTSTDPTVTILGTNGWRAPIGGEFSVLNVHRTARGIVETLKSDTYLKLNGFDSFDDLKRAGIVLFRDNRYMGDEFIAAAHKELVAAGITTFIAGECPTGVGSVLVTELGAAGSINFTPSHNPMNFAGLKFNPADGGPALPEITSIIEEMSNGFMTADFVPADPPQMAIDDLTAYVNAKKIFADFMERSTVFDIKKTRAWLLENKLNLSILVDNLHGSSRGYIEAVLGDEVVETLSATSALRFLHTDDDVSFHGIKPEPSAKNQRPIIDVLAKSDRPLTLGVAMDPDADRIRFADAHMDIPMNVFGAIAYASLLDRGLDGGIASTAPSSDFAFEIARRRGKPVYETEVGFKWFRPYLSSGEALVAFEESDGISFRGHTLEKCAIAGFFAALDVMMTKGKNLSEIHGALQREYGYFYQTQSKVAVKGVDPKGWKEYKDRVLQVFAGGLVKEGDEIEIGGEMKRVKTVMLLSDGVKYAFDDSSWIALRGSGTETLFRIYREVVGQEPIEDLDARWAAYGEAGSAILAKARSAVDNG